MPAKLVSGPNFKAAAKVTSNGYLNVYRVTSKHGDLEVTSTALLEKRAREIDAIAKMEQVKETDTYRESAQEAGEDVIAGAKALVTNPVDTVGGAVSGVGKLFARAGESVFGGSRSESEDDRLKTLIGFSSTKRDYAYEFGVDVYPRNPHLQEALDDVA